MQPAWYTIESVSIRAKNVLFTRDRLTKSHSHLFPERRESIPAVKSDVPLGQRLLVWTRTNGLEVKVTTCNAIDLRRPRSISIQIITGADRVQGGRLSLRAASAGLRLDTARAKQIAFHAESKEIVEDCNKRSDIAASPTTTSTDQPGVIVFGAVNAKDTLEIGIPYSLENDLPDIQVKVEIAYTTDAGEFQYSRNYKIDVTLPVSVNVQDIFKDTTLFSKFSIGTATAVPLQLFSCHVEGNASFEASSAMPKNGRIDVFPGQPYRLLSRIRARPGAEGISPSSQSPQRLLHLQIQYQCLDEVYYNQLEASLKATLKAADALRFHRLLRDTLKSVARRMYSSSDMERIYLMGQLPKGVYEDYEWGSILSGIQADDNTKLEGLLREWHQVCRIRDLLG